MTNLQALRELLDAATPGPWELEMDDDGYHYRICAPSLTVSFRSINGDEGLLTDDAQLIVAMHNCLPELLAVVEAAEDLGHSGNCAIYDRAMGDCNCHIKEVKRALAALTTKLEQMK